jgi:small conductance mechanosensitive channel
VPNGQIVRVGNRSQLWSVALLDVTVAHEADLGRARTVLHDVANDLCERDEFAPSILEAPEVLGVEELGVDGVTLRLTVKVTPGSQWTLQRALREAIKAAFDANGVSIPQRTVWMRVPPDGGEEAPSPSRE